MKRYVFRYRGPADETARAVAALQTDHRLHLVEAAGRNLLVEAEDHAIREWAAGTDGQRAWAVAEETVVPLPDSRLHPR